MQKKTDRMFLPLSALDPQDVTILVIDMQDRFCRRLTAEQEQAALDDYQKIEDHAWPDAPPLYKAFKRAKWQHQFDERHFPRGTAETEALAARLPAAIDRFRQTGAAVTHVYYGPSDMPASQVDFIVPPLAGDTVVGKNKDSAFAENRLESRKKLILCGVNLSSCVRATALDAKRKGYDVHVILDLTANDRSIKVDPKNTVRYLRKKGIIVTSQADILAQLKAPSGAVASEPTSFTPKF